MEDLVREDHAKEKHVGEDHDQEKHVEGHVGDYVEDHLPNDKENNDREDDIPNHRITYHDYICKKFRVTKVAPTAYYIPEFITDDEERSLISSIYCAPKPKWDQLLNRRLQSWGGVPTPKGMVRDYIPYWLTKYFDRIIALDMMNGNIPNHVLINEYLPGQGIMLHNDGSVYHPTICTISLKSPTVIKFQEARKTYTDTPPLVFSLFLEPRSLLIVRDQLFHEYLHGIEQITEDKMDGTIANLNMVSNEYANESIIPRLTRLSLTIRHVPKARSYLVPRFVRNM